jgi:hypothetical protein
MLAKVVAMVNTGFLKCIKAQVLKIKDEQIVLNVFNWIKGNYREK